MFVAGLVVGMVAMIIVQLSLNIIFHFCQKRRDRIYTELLEEAQDLFLKEIQDCEQQAIDDAIKKLEDHANEDEER